MQAVACLNNKMLLSGFTPFSDDFCDFQRAALPIQTDRVIAGGIACPASDDWR